MPQLQNIDQPLSISKKVAIIGSSSIIKNQNFASIEHRYDTVIRFNRAPTKGYEKIVGTKTSIRLVNGHVFKSVPFKRWKEDDTFIEKIKNTNILVCAPDHVTPNEKVDPSNTIYKLNYGAAVRSLKQTEVMPTIGLLGILLVVQAGIVPHVYGWSEGEMCHYYNSRNKKGSNYHSFEDEWKIINKLSQSIRIILHRE